VRAKTEFSPVVFLRRSRIAYCGARTGLILLIVVILAGIAGTGCRQTANPLWRMRPQFNAVPKDTLSAVAREVEQAIQSGAREPKIADREGVKINTPEILQAIRTRAARSVLINEFLDTGFAAEHRDGLIYVHLSKEYTKSTKRRQRDRQAYLVKNENDDRWAIYEGLLNANKYGARSLSAIQDIFAEARQQAMTPGQKYQGADGKLLTKEN